MKQYFNQFYKVWTFMASGLNLIGLALTLYYGTTLPWIIASVIIYGIFIANIFGYTPSWSWFIGYANWVSIVRLFVVFVLFIHYTDLDRVILFILSLVATCLDGFDGYLARKFGHTSEVGSKLDSEIDGFFVLVLSWIHVDQQNLEWWILIPGGIKPAYQIAFSWLPEKVKEFMPNEYRAAIGISFFLSLLVPFVTQNSFLLFLPYAFGTLVIISFITDALDRLNLVNGKDQQS